MCLTQFQKKKWKNGSVCVGGGAVFTCTSGMNTRYRKKHLYACVHCALPRTPCNAN